VTDAVKVAKVVHTVPISHQQHSKQAQFTQRAHSAAALPLTRIAAKKQNDEQHRSLNGPYRNHPAVLGSQQHPSESL
jgi:hypothetical protein